MTSFKSNFNDGVDFECKRSEVRDGDYVMSVSTREFYVSGPELEQLWENIGEMLGKKDDGQEGKDRESSESSGGDEESLATLLSEADKGSGKPRS